MESRLERPYLSHVDRQTSPRHRVLVIEDDPAIRQGLVDALTFEGYEVRWAADAPRGLEAALQGRDDLILLDLMLPGGDGFDLLGELRRRAHGVPVIILTARGREADRVRGLKMGADDYVVKPFSIRELLARAGAVLRRSAERGEISLHTPIPGGQIDLARRELRFDDGERAELSERETELLAYLITHAGRAISREEMLEKIWRLNPRAHGQTRTIDMHIARLRDKLRDAELIRTVRGKGYMFGAPLGGD